MGTSGRKGTKIDYLVEKIYEARNESWGGPLPKVEEITYFGWMNQSQLIFNFSSLFFFYDKKENSG